MHMGPGLVILLAAAALILVIAAAVYAWKQEQARREAMMAFAHARGWSFDPSKDASHDDRYA